MRPIHLLLILLTGLSSPIIGQVSVETKDPDGKPIPGVHVLLIPLDKDDKNQDRKSRTDIRGSTDSDGILLPAPVPQSGTKYRICIYPPEGFIRPSNRVVTFSEKPEIMVLPKSGTITIRLLDNESNEELKDAVVYCFESSNSDPPSMYAYNRHSPLKYQDGGISHFLSKWSIDRFAGFRAEATGYEPGFSTNCVPSYQDNVVEIRMKRAERLEGFVKEPDGTACAGARVKLFFDTQKTLRDIEKPIYERNAGITDIYTDDRGFFSLAPPPPGGEFVIVHSTGMQSGKISDLRNNPQIRLLGMPTLKGAFYKDGKPVAGMELKVESNWDERNIGFIPRGGYDLFRVTTGSDGRFQVPRLWPWSHVVVRGKGVEYHYHAAPGHEQYLRFNMEETFVAQKANLELRVKTDNGTLIDNPEVNLCWTKTLPEPEFLAEGWIRYQGIDPGGDVVRVSWTDSNGDVWWSDPTLVNFSLRTLAKIEMVVKRSVPLRGELDKEVPRPIETGYVIAVAMNPKSESWRSKAWSPGVFRNQNEKTYPDLTTKVDIQKDGTFLVPGLPTGEVMGLYVVAGKWVNLPNQSGFWTGEPFFVDAGKHPTENVKVPMALSRKISIKLQDQLGKGVPGYYVVTAVDYKSACRSGAAFGLERVPVLDIPFRPDGSVWREIPPKLATVFSRGVLGWETGTPVTDDTGRCDFGFLPACKTRIMVTPSPGLGLKSSHRYRQYKQVTVGPGETEVTVVYDRPEK